MIRTHMDKTLAFILIVTLSFLLLDCDSDKSNKKNNLTDSLSMHNKQIESEMNNIIYEEEMQNTVNYKDTIYETAKVDLLLLKENFILKNVKTFDHDFVRKNIEDNCKLANNDLIKNLLNEKAPIDFNNSHFVSWQQRNNNFIEFTLGFSDNFAFYINYYIFNNNQEFVSMFTVYYEGGSDFNIQKQYGTFTNDNIYKSHFTDETLDNINNIVTVDSIIKIINIENSGKIIEQTDKHRFTRKN
jgi:hypothetical protein